MVTRAAVLPFVVLLLPGPADAVSPTNRTPAFVQKRAPNRLVSWLRRLTTPPRFIQEAVAQSQEVGPHKGIAGRFHDVVRRREILTGGLAAIAAILLPGPSKADGWDLAGAANPSTAHQAQGKKKGPGGKKKAKPKKGTRSSADRLDVYHYPLPRRVGVTGRYWRWRKRTKSRHKGVDLGASFGTPLSAATDGVVLKAGWATGYGWVIVIRRSDGFKTIYGHLKRGMAVQAGDRVRAGQRIGHTGNSGRSSGPHLHFEVRVNGSANSIYHGASRNPASYFPI